MSVTFKYVIEKIGKLSPDEKALVAHCLISSLEVKHDDSVDKTWKDLAEKRLSELEPGNVTGVSWDEIKQNIKRNSG
ncbi:MAG: addiction module protein [Gammaproteobacteria bacterium]|nr:addiction module protein [Gammaproteobacteria bacterium]